MNFDYVFAEDPEFTETENKIRVVYCEPGKYAREAEIGTGLTDLQKAVQGLIEPYYGLEDPNCCIVCNDEGKFNGMRPNRAVYDKDGEMMDIIFGPFFICDCSGEDFGSLTDAQIEKYKDQFHDPEMLLMTFEGYKMVPFSPEIEEDLER